MAAITEAERQLVSEVTKVPARLKSFLKAKKGWLEEEEQIEQVDEKTKV